MARKHYKNLKVLVDENTAYEIAKTITKARWGIKTPPAWLACAVLNMPYYPPMTDNSRSAANG